MGDEQIGRAADPSWSTRRRSCSRPFSDRVARVRARRCSRSAGVQLELGREGRRGPARSGRALRRTRDPHPDGRVGGRHQGRRVSRALGAAARAASGRIEVGADLAVTGVPGRVRARRRRQHARTRRQAVPAARLGGAPSRDAARPTTSSPTSTARTAEPFRYRDKGIMAMIGRNAAIAEVGPRRRELHGVARVRVVARRARLAAQRLPRRESARSGRGAGTTSASTRASAFINRPDATADRLGRVAPWPRRVRAAERRFRGEPAVELRRRRRSSAVFTPRLGMTGVSLRYRGGRAPRPPGRARCAARRSHRRACRCSRRGRTDSRRRRYRAGGRHGRPRRAGRCRSTTTGCRSTGSSSAQPGWTVDRLATRGDTARAARVDRRRRAGVPVPAPHRGHRDRARAAQLARRHDDRADRSPGGADRVRLASVPPAARRAARPLASASARRAGISRSTTAGIPTGDVVPEARRVRRRSGGARSTTATRSAATGDSRSSATTGRSVELRVRFATIRSRRCGSRAASRSSRSSRWPHRPTRWSTARRRSSAAATRSPRSFTLDARPTPTEEHHVDPHRGLRDHRRHQDGRRRRAQRLDRLVVRAPDRLGRGVRRAARRARARAVEHRAEGRRSRRPGGSTPATRSCSRPSSRPPTAR